MAIGLGLITAIILIKYKPTYEVKVQGMNLGYVNSKNSFEKDKMDNTSLFKIYL